MKRTLKKTITTLIVVGFIIIDFSLAAALKIVGLFEHSYITSSIREAHYRKAHPIYHHDLEKNICNYIAERGKQDYRSDTYSLGFKDSSKLSVSLNTLARTRAWDRGLNKCRAMWTLDKNYTMNLVKKV